MTSQEKAINLWYLFLSYKPKKKTINTFTSFFCMYWYVSIFSEKYFWPQYMYHKMSPNNRFRWCPLGKLSHLGLEQLHSKYLVKNIFETYNEKHYQNLYLFIDTTSIKQAGLATHHEQLRHLDFGCFELIYQERIIPPGIYNIEPATFPGCAYIKSHYKPWSCKGIKNRK